MEIQVTITAFRRYRRWHWRITWSDGRSLWGDAEENTEVGALRTGVAFLEKYGAW